MFFRALLSFFISISGYAYNPGDIASDFELKSHTGEQVKLSQFSGKFIILEWFNDGCPYVQKHYRSGNMQAIQNLYAENDNVIWLTISSSAKGKQGYLGSIKSMTTIRNQLKMKSRHLLDDSEARIGKIFGAKVTPHIFILDPKRVVRYVGAIDSISSSNPKDIKRARNYITSSMSKLLLQQNPKPAKTRPYGCSVKY